MFNLWDYQEEGVSSVTDFFDHGGKSVILQSPTGTGKTLIASTFIERMKEQSKPVYFVTSSGALLWQFSKHLESMGMHHGIIKSGCPTLRYRVQVISVQSLMNRISMIDEPYAIIIEESHHAAANQFMNIIQKWPNVRILGLTATPQRTDGKPLNMFEHLILARPVRWFMDNYYLSDFDYYIPAECNTDGVHRQYGDFKASELNEKLKNDKTRIGNIVEYYEKYARNLPAIAFGTSIADSEDIAGRFKDAGYDMIPIHSKIEGNVQKILDRARDGKINYISSCDLIGEGISVNGLTVELDGRPTDSLVVKLQHSGRVLRACYAPGFDLSTVSGRRDAIIAGGKGKAQILDFSSNYLRHGLPDDERTWSLTGAIKEKTASKYKRCPSCQRPVLTFAATCPYCSYEFPKQAAPPEETPEREGELIPIGELKSADKNEVTIKIAREAHDLKSAIRIGKENGINSQGAWYIWCRVLKKSAHVGKK